MVKIAFVFLFTCSGLSCLAQRFHGTVSDAQTRKPLSYCNIGVVGKNIGGVSDSQGNFSIDLSGIEAADKIKVSYVGYSPKTFTIRDIDFSKSQVIVLNPESTMLAAVEVKAQREKTVSMGNKTNRFNGYTGWSGFRDKLKGQQRGMLVETGGRKILLQRASIRMKHNSYDRALFRFHIFTLADSLPDKTLIPRDVFFTSAKANEWIHIDLSPFSIVMSENFCLSVEWLEAWGKAEDDILTVAMTSKKGVVYSRESPEAKWRKNTSDRTPVIFVEGYVLDEKTISTNEMHIKTTVATANEPVVGQREAELPQVAGEIIEQKPAHKFTTRGISKKLGIQETTKFTDGGTMPIEKESGGIFGTLIENVDKVYSLMGVNFNLRTNEYDSLYLGFNIYTVDKQTGLPQQRYFKDDIILKIGKEKGWIKRDLTPYQIVINQNVVVTLRPMKGISKDKKPKGLFFARGSTGVSFHGDLYENKWRKDTSGYSIYLTVKE